MLQNNCEEQEHLNQIQILHLGKDIVKGSTQVNAHFLKLHFCMFKRSQMKHNDLDY
jgi:hypothetical protein